MLAELVKVHPELKFTALVRNPSHVEAVRSLGVEVVQGSFNDTDLISSHARAADIRAIATLYCSMSRFWLRRELAWWMMENPQASYSMGVERLYSQMAGRRVSMTLTAKFGMCVYTFQ